MEHLPKQVFLHQRMRMNPQLIGPCGMNCNVCSAYLAYTHAIPKARGRISHCRGCGPQGKSCAYLKKWCDPLRKNEIRFCFECNDFPCHRLKHIDERYRNTYGISFIENLKFIQANGVSGFTRAQERQFGCDRCRADVLSVHNDKCFSCDTVRTLRRKYRRPPTNRHAQLRRHS